jgi:hypothetical protein
MGIGSPCREFSGWGVALTHLHLAPRLQKEYSYTSTPLLGLRDLFEGELYDTTGRIPLKLLAKRFVTMHSILLRVHSLHLICALCRQIAVN